MDAPVVGRDVRLAIGEDLARPAGLTAARWLVLTAVLHAPATVPDIARELSDVLDAIAPPNPD